MQDRFVCVRRQRRTTCRGTSPRNWLLLPRNWHSGGGSFTATSLRADHAGQIRLRSAAEEDNVQRYIAKKLAPLASQLAQRRWIVHGNLIEGGPCRTDSFAFGGRGGQRAEVHRQEIGSSCLAIGTAAVDRSRQPH